jgi:hypothetical protein
VIGLLSPSRAIRTSARVFANLTANFFHLPMISIWIQRGSLAKVMQFNSPSSKNHSGKPLENYFMVNNEGKFF